MSRRCITLAGQSNPLNAPLHAEMLVHAAVCIQLNEPMHPASDAYPPKSKSVHTPRLERNQGGARCAKGLIAPNPGSLHTAICSLLSCMAPYAAFLEAWCTLSEP